MSWNWCWKEDIDVYRNPNTSWDDDLTNTKGELVLIIKKRRRKSNRYQCWAYRIKDRTVSWVDLVSLKQETSVVRIISTKDELAPMIDGREDREEVEQLSCWAYKIKDRTVLLSWPCGLQQEKKKKLNNYHAGLTGSRTGPYSWVDLAACNTRRVSTTKMI